MKSIIVLSTQIFIAATVFAQGIPVSHTPEKKNVLLEEYTGIHCPYCADGHKIANQLEANNPGNVVLINIHAGSYAVPNTGEPDFRTSEGTYIAGQSGLTGYPAGSINRHVFPAYSETTGKTAMSRADWAAAASQILAQDAYANLGVEASVDIQTNLLTVHVQVYYTGNSPLSTNRIHVALLQDNVEGPQAAQQLNPTQILPSGNYNHGHILRQVISGVSGKTINTGVGTTVNEYFTYTIPADFIGIPAVLEDLNVAAFLSESLQEVITAQVVPLTFTNFPGANNATLVSATVENEKVCGFTTAPIVTIKNFGSQSLTSLNIDYSINGSPVKTKNWTGDIAPIGQVEVALDAINYFPEATNTITITTSMPNGNADANTSDDILLSDFATAADASNTVTMALQLDNYGSEITWELLNSNQTQLYSGGPYSNSSAQVISSTFNLTSGDCYEFKIYDSYGDGLINGAGLTLVDDQNLTIIANYKAYGGAGKVVFGVDVAQPDSSDVFTGIFSPAGVAGGIAVFPNPTKGKINVNLDFSNELVSSVYLTDMLGKRVKTIGQNEINAGGTLQISMADLTPGIYFLNAESGAKKYTEKILVSF
ncbi:MAG: Omp28-related outer membrane protein [Chitinophagales bacterium]|nr:Omp28-related outer membrane protein [Chitinophagales bacterium]